jgi:hypothetical protein
MSCVDSAIPSAEEFPQADAGFPAGMIAVRAAGVICPGGAATALLVAGSPVVSGEPLVFAHPVTVAPAVVRRGGAVQAGGWLPGHVRLGLLEQQLGDGVIEAVIEGAVRAGRLARPARRRLMSLELTCRFTVAMTLSPECDYRETMARLAGHLLDLPWARRWHVPTTKVFTGWRRLGWQVMEELFWQAPARSPARPRRPGRRRCGAARSCARSTGSRSTCLPPAPIAGSSGPRAPATAAARSRRHGRCW